jgi:hypothetical protein
LKVNIYFGVEKISEVFGFEFYEIVVLQYSDIKQQMFFYTIALARC